MTCDCFEMILNSSALSMSTLPRSFLELEYRFGLRVRIIKSNRAAEKIIALAAKSQDDLGIWQDLRGLMLVVLTW